MAFWIGFALGHGVDFHLECWKSEFTQPIYGVEGEFQIDKDYFRRRLADAETLNRISEKGMERLRERMEEAMLKNEFTKVGEFRWILSRLPHARVSRSGSCQKRAVTWKRTIMIPPGVRAGECHSAEGRTVGRKNHEHAAGKAEYVWNIWRQTVRVEALNQLRAFLREKTEAAYEYGRLLGVFRENATYMSEYDDRVTALGGARALHHLGVVK